MKPTSKTYHGDCIKLFDNIEDNSIDLTLTDIPYDGVNNHVSNGLRVLDKGKAAIITFDLQEFLNQILKKTSGTIIIFCGVGQVSEIWNFF